MLGNIEIKPAKGRRVRDPRTGHPFPDDVWTRLPKTFYILRRIRDKDLESREVEESAPITGRAASARTDGGE